MALISHRFPISKATEAYALVGGSESSLGILLEYPGVDSATAARSVTLSPQTPAPSQRAGKENTVLGFIGSGNYAKAILIPAFKETGARLRLVSSASGASGLHAGRKFGFEETTTDTGRLFSDPETNIIVIATRHDSHAQFVLKALEAGKHVFVEKPLCLRLDELAQIEQKISVFNSQRSETPLLMVGFNRRFAPQVQKIKSLLDGVSGPKALVMTVNAGAIPADSWIQDKAVGGGRVIGEACHFIDLLRFLVGAPIVGWQKSAVDRVAGDTLSIQLNFADDSIGTVHYFANGSKSFPKERLEIFTSGRVLQLNNFRTLNGFGWPGFKKMRMWQQDKGQKACAAAFVQAVVKGGAAPIPLDEVIEVSRVSIEAAQMC
jgi:predicted dehydrogenase